MFIEPIFFRVVVRHFLPRLLPAWFAILLAVSQIDAITHWPTLRAQLQALAPVSAGLLALVLVGAWSALAGVALTAVEQRPALRWLLRQPVSEGRFGVAAVLAASPAWAVPIGVAWLLTAGAWIVPVAVAFVVAGSAMSWFVALRRHLANLAAIACLFLTGAAVAWAPVTVLLVIAAGLVLAPVLGKALRHGSTAKGAALVGGQIPGRASGPVTALWRRNGICLLRRHRSDAWGTLATAMPAAALLAAFRFNGGLAGSELWVGFVILLVVTALPVYAALEELAGTLGTPRLLAHRAAVGVASQLGALLLTAATLFAPAAVLLLVVALPAFGALSPLAPLVIAGVLAMTVVALLLRLRFLPRASGIGIFAVLAVLATVALSLWPIWVSIALPLAGAAAGSTLLSRREWIHA